MLEKIFLNLLQIFPAEFSHKIAIILLKYKLIPYKKKIKNNLLKTRLFGFSLSNPIGLAAGFDKNAEALPGLLKQNFSFIEVGTITPLEQAGNNKPRIYRIKKDESIINRLGFPNKGAKKVLNNLKKLRKYHSLGSEPIIGVNISYNKTSKHPLEDFKQCYNELSSVADYITINVSSPNTPGLRDFQNKEKLEPLLKSVSSLRDLNLNKLKRKLPLAIKISPNLKSTELRDIVNLSIKYNFQAIIATNTSIERKVNSNDIKFNEPGGLSGKLILEESNYTLEQLKRFTNNKIEIIGAGGVYDTNSLLSKLSLGASAIQLYTALVYNGISLIDKIILDLINYLEKNE